MKNWVLILAISSFIVACNSDDLDDQFDITKIDRAPVVTDIAGEDCIEIDINDDQVTDLKVCYYQLVSSGGIRRNTHYVETLMDSLVIDVALATDTLYRCVRMTDNQSFPEFTNIYDHIDLFDCPQDAVFTIIPYNDFIPVVHDTKIIDESLGLFQSGKFILSFRETTSNIAKSKNITRKYWLNVNKKYLHFKYKEDGGFKKGYLQLSNSYVHEFGIQID